MATFIKALTAAGKIFQVGTRLVNRMTSSGGNTVSHTPYVPPFANKR